MGTWTNIRTEKKLGPYLSKTFQSFVNGPDIEGKDCELNQVSKILNLDLTSFTLTNYSGLWNEDDFPPDFKEELLKKQLEEDKIWNDLFDFLNLINQLISSLESKKLTPKQLNHKLNWWKGYFEFPITDNDKDSFYNDLKIIQNFLIDSKQSGETKTAFYVN